MNTCPNCGKTISELWYSAKITTLAVFTAEGDYQEDAGEDLDERDGEEHEYNCPECGALLFTDHGAALKFLSKRA